MLMRTADDFTFLRSLPALRLTFRSIFGSSPAGLVQLVPHVLWFRQVYICPCYCVLSVALSLSLSLPASACNAVCVFKVHLDYEGVLARHLFESFVFKDTQMVVSSGSLPTRRIGRGCSDTNSPDTLQYVKECLGDTLATEERGSIVSGPIPPRVQTPPRQEVSGRKYSDVAETTSVFKSRTESMDRYWRDLPWKGNNNSQ